MSGEEVGTGNGGGEGIGGIASIGWEVKLKGVPGL